VAQTDNKITHTTYIYDPCRVVQIDNKITHTITRIHDPCRVVWTNNTTHTTIHILRVVWTDNNTCHRLQCLFMIHVEWYEQIIAHHTLLYTYLEMYGQKIIRTMQQIYTSMIHVEWYRQIITDTTYTAMHLRDPFSCFPCHGTLSPILFSPCFPPPLLPPSLPPQPTCLPSKNPTTQLSKNLPTYLGV